MQVPVPRSHCFILVGFQLPILLKLTRSSADAVLDFRLDLTVPPFKNIKIVQLLNVRKATVATTFTAQTDVNKSICLWRNVER